MTTLEELTGLYGSSPAEPAPRSVAAFNYEVSGQYADRLSSLSNALNGKYRRALDRNHSYKSDSEADIGLVSAMVARHFSDGEIWRTLEDSAIYTARVEKKGEKHARELFAEEIRKARNTVTPFAGDPGAPTRPAVFNHNGHGSASGDGRANESRSKDASPAPAVGGFIGAYRAHATNRTDAPIAAHDLTAVGVLSALAGPGPRLPLATDIRGVRLALWTMYIVNSTVGRKSTVIGLGADILEDVLGQRALLQWEMSPQALVQVLQERENQATIFCRDEYAGLMQQMNRGGHLAGLQQNLIRAYDGRALQLVRTKKKVDKDGPKVEDTDFVREPYLTQLTASTRTAFVESATIENVRNGFLARFCFVSGASDPKPIPVLTPELAAEYELLVRLARDFYAKAHRTSVINFEDVILERLWRLEQMWGKEALQTTHPDAAGPSLKRLSETVLKVAALLAIDLTPADSLPVIHEAHFDSALALAQRWKSDTLQLIDELGSTLFMRDTAAVLETVNAHVKDGIGRSALLRAHRNIRARDFKEILERLQEQEEIEIVDEQQSKKGPAQQRAYPFGRAPRNG